MATIVCADGDGDDYARMVVGGRLEYGGHPVAGAGGATVVGLIQQVCLTVCVCVCVCVCVTDIHI